MGYPLFNVNAKAFIDLIFGLRVELQQVEM